MKTSQNIDIEEMKSQTKYEDLKEIQQKLDQFCNEPNPDYSKIRQILYNNRFILFDKLSSVSASFLTNYGEKINNTLSNFCYLFENSITIACYSEKIKNFDFTKSEDRKKETEFITHHFSEEMTNIKESIGLLSDVDFDLFKEYLVKIRKNSADILDITKKMISLSNIDVSEVKTIIEYFESEVEDSKKYFRNNNKKNINKVEEAKIIESPTCSRKSHSEIHF